MNTDPAVPVPERLPPGGVALLLTAAASLALPVVAGAAVLAVVTLAWWWWGRGRRSRAIGGLLLVATACGVAASLRGLPVEGGRLLERPEFAERYRALWSELERFAKGLEEQPAPGHPPTPAAAFTTLEALLSPAADGRVGVQVLDGNGETIAWAGQGLVHDRLGPAMPSGASWAASFDAVTLHWRAPLPAWGEGWSVVVGRSLATDVLPPELTPGGPVPTPWTLAPAGSASPDDSIVTVDAAGFPTLLVERPDATTDLTARAQRRQPLRRVAAALLGCALLLAAGPVHRHLLQSPLLAGAAAGLLGIALGARPPAAAALAGGAALAVACFPRPRASAGRSRPSRAAGAAPPPWLESTVLVLRGLTLALLVLLAASGAPLLRQRHLWTAALALAALAAVALGARAGGSARGTWAWSLAALALLLGAGSPWQAASLVAVVLGVAAAGRGLGAGLRRPGLQHWILAGLLAAAAAGILADRLRGPVRTPGREQLPRAAEVAAIRDEVADHFASVELATWRLPAAGDGALQDLALALWRDSPLARAGILSAVAVQRDGRTLSSFAFGLPVGGGGLLDLGAPTWEELALDGWEEAWIEGQPTLPGLGQNARLLYWAWLRPGFRSRRPLSPELAVGLMRGPPTPRTTLRTDDVAEPPRSSPRLAAALGGSGAAGGARLQGALMQTVRGAGGGGLAVALFLLFALPLRDIAGRLWYGWSSYSLRLVAVFATLVLATLLPLQALLVGIVARRNERAQLERGLAAMESAQRVLGEYVDALEPGFGLQTALDDDLLRWLARVLHHEVNLYWDSAVYASSRRELFTAGLLPQRIPGEAYAQLALQAAPVAVRAQRLGETDYLELYAALRVPGSGGQGKLFLSVPLLAQQEAGAAEVRALRRRFLAAAGGIFGLLLLAGAAVARTFSVPLQQIARGTRRIADGAEGLDLQPSFRELQVLATAIDAMAGRIAAGRRDLVREKELVETVVDSVDSAVVSVDGDGRVVLCNRRGRALLGARVGEALLPTLAAQPAFAPLAEAWEASPRRPQQGEIKLREPGTGEELRSWSYVATPLDGNSDLAWLLVLEDVTEVVRGQRLAAWAEMARIIAHEIKNPLTPIRLSAEHLREVHETRPQEVDRVLERCTDNILRQVEELRRIANEFALFSRVPRLDRQACDLVDLVRSVTSAYELAGGEEPSVALRPAPETLPVDIDPRLVERALRNLVENARRAAGNGGRVEVSVAVQETEAQVIIEDSGPGVAEDLLGRIFEPYFSTREDGTGLGLAISRQIAREHGGSLAARNHSRLGGLEMRLSLPWVPPAAETGEAPGA